MNEQLLETWEIHNRVNLYLLDALKEEHLRDGLTSKGRNAGDQIMLCLKQAGHAVDKKVAFGIWEWGSR